MEAFPGTAAGLCEPLWDAMFCPLPADVAQLVEQRFRNPPTRLANEPSPRRNGEHLRPQQTVADRDTVNAVSIAQLDVLHQNFS